MDKSGLWSLSPAYDVCFVYRPGSQWVSSQSLTVNGKRENITEADFAAMAKNVNIKKAVAIINDVKKAVGKWAHYATEKRVEERLWKGIEGELRGV